MAILGARALITLKVLESSLEQPRGIPTVPTSIFHVPKQLWWLLTTDREQIT